MSRIFALITGLLIGAFSAGSLTLGFLLENDFYSTLAIALGIKVLLVLGGLLFYMARVTDKDEIAKERTTL